MASTKQHADNASESTPLLQAGGNIDSGNVPDEPASSETRQFTEHPQKWRVVLLLYAYVFFVMLGSSLYPAALIQVLEDIICADYYATPSGAAALLQLPAPNEMCKTHVVQKELALVIGFLQLAPMFAGVLCTVPYSLLADRIGRKPVLMLSGAGIAFAFAWVVAVCYFQFVSVRWIWLAGAFLFIGGGDPVLSSVAHVMITDTTERSERAQIFLCLHAANVGSGFFGPAISAALMEAGHVWTVLLLAVAFAFFGAFVVTSFIPETLDLSQSPAGSSSAAIQGGDSDSEVSVGSSKPNSSLLAPLRNVLLSNRQAVLLICIFAPQTAARELFNAIGLQYSSIKFSLSYGRGNVLLSIFQGTQGLFSLVLLPLITRLIAAPRGWSAWTRDRYYTVASIGATSIGLLVIALAPVLSIEILGLLLVSLGNCSNGIIMSLMGGEVRANEVSAIYSAAVMIGTVVHSLAGPAFNALLVAGLELGWKWLGLPFAVMSCIMACEFAASLFISKKRDEDLHNK
ncbi:MFS general substrate transporter [Xylaria venustula]|nr:MFS general substrate transporter [Xylaria venustula]